MCRSGTDSVARGSLRSACLFSGGEAGDVDLQGVQVGRGRRHGDDLRARDHPRDDGGGQRRRLRPGERREGPASEAVDATALALAKDAPNATDGELKRRGKELAKALLKSAKGVSADTIAVSREARTIRVTASGAMKTA